MLPVIVASGVEGDNDVIAHKDQTPSLKIMSTAIEMSNGRPTLGSSRSRAVR
jgi:hypothetical protein